MPKKTVKSKKIDKQALAEHMMCAVCEYLDENKMGLSVQVLDDNTIEVLDGDKVVARWTAEK